MNLVLLLALFLTQQCMANTTPGQRFLGFGGFRAEKSVYVYSTDQVDPICELPNLPFTADRRPQALRIGGNITICGGGMDFCVTLSETLQWTQSMELDVSLAPAVTSPDDTIWTFFESQLSRSFIHVWTQGQDGFEKTQLDFNFLRDSCAVRRNDSHAIISTGSQDVFWYEEDGQHFQKWEPGKLSVLGTSCGMAKSGEQYVIAGGASFESVATVELFDFSANMWLEGPELPHPVASAASLDLGNTFGFIGGRNIQESTYYKETYQYDYENGWMQLPVELKEADMWLGVLMLEEGELQC